MTTAPVYLDYNASAPVRPEVAAVVARLMSAAGNPSSVHQAGRAARRAIEQARRQVAALAGADPGQVIFTGGGTEANNQAILGAPAARILISAIEHDSVREAAAADPRPTSIVAVGRDGVLSLDALGRGLSAGSGPALVSVMLANNETGALQPIRQIADIAHDAGALVHCDAVQAAGKTVVDLAALGVDMLSLSAHKIGGPQGVGALIVGDAVALQPLIHGGGQERGRRSGTENMAGIAGFGEAARLARRDLSAFADLAGLRDRLESEVRRLAPEAEIHAAQGPRLANTSCLSMPGVDSETQVIGFDLEGIMISAGSACSSGKVHASGVLSAMGVPETLASSAIRVSLGWTTTAADVDRFLAAWSALHGRLARRSAAHG